MSERYSKVFALSENLYATGSPIVIEAGALQKDNQTGGILAQIKMKNISAKVIRAVKVKLTLFDVAGNVLADGVEHQYLDLKASRDESFGSKSAIRLKESTTRSFAVNITEVIFEDESVWNGTANPWETLSKQTALINRFNDEELVKQFELKYGSPCHNVLLEEKDLWNCACGASNKDNEPKCHKCGKLLKDLKELDVPALEAEKEKRLEVERKEAETKKKRIKKIAIIIVPIVCILIVGLSDILSQTKVILQNCKVGDTITFGSYEQDYNSSNGAEDIEWLVLEVKNDKALIISKYALNKAPYYSAWKDITWEKSSVYNWLNDLFLNSAFTADEQSFITSEGVFLLSVNEAKEYFSSNSARACSYIGDKDNDCWWWLRNNGWTSAEAAIVKADGSVYTVGNRVDGTGGVRPAIWVSWN